MPAHHLFNPLNSRLLSIQNQFVVAEVFPFPTYYELFCSFESQIGNYSSQELVPIAESYIEKMDVLLSNIQQKLTAMGMQDFQLPPLKVIDDQKVDNAKPKKVINETSYPNEIYYKEELNYYKSRLMDVIGLNKGDSTKRIFLPPDFTAPNVRVHIENPIQVSTLANLLYIFQRRGNMAPLDAKPLAQLIMPIFGVSVQTFRTEYGQAEYNYKKKQEIKKVKEFVKQLLDDIETLELAI